MSTSRGDRIQAALLVAPVLACAWPFSGSLLAHDVFPAATGIGIVTLGLLASAVFLVARRAWPSARGLLFLLVPIGIALVWISLDRSTDTFEGSRVLMHWLVALHCVLAGASLASAGRSFFVRGIVVASLCYVAYALFDGERAFTGALGNTGSISEVALPGAAAGAALAVYGGGAWRFVGAFALVAFLAYTARVPVLAGSLAAAVSALALLVAARAADRVTRVLAGCALLLALAALLLPLARDRGVPGPTESEAGTPAVHASPTGGVGVRALVWRGSLALLADHPFAGVGTGQFAARFPEHRLAEEIERTTYGRRRAEETEVEHPHADWLAPWLEGGIVAGLAWTVFLALAALAAVRRLRARDPFEIAVASAALGVLVNALVRGPLLQNPASAPLAFGLFGILLARADISAKANLARRAVVVGSGLLLLGVTSRAVAFVRHGFALQEVARPDTRLEDVRAANAAALEACPDSVIALTMAARLSEGRGDAVPIVVAEWARVLDHRPQRIEALLSIGRLLAPTEPAVAASAFERVLRLDAAHPVAMQNLGTLALNAGRVAEGLARLDRLPRSRAVSKDWLEHMAALLALRGVDDAADALFERVDPATRDASAEQCLVFSKRAETEARDSLVVDAWKERAHLRWARSHAADQRFGDAVRSYRQALRLSEIHGIAAPRLILETSAALRRAGRDEDAARMAAGHVPTPQDLSAVPDWARETLRASLAEAKK